MGQRPIAFFLLHRGELRHRSAAWNKGEQAVKRFLPGPALRLECKKLMLCCRFNGGTFPVHN
jgi:hypothetical protein